MNCTLPCLGIFLLGVFFPTKTSFGATSGPHQSWEEGAETFHSPDPMPQPCQEPHGHVVIAGVHSLHQGHSCHWPPCGCGGHPALVLQSPCPALPSSLLSQPRAALWVRKRSASRCAPASVSVTLFTRHRHNAPGKYFVVHI